MTLPPADLALLEAALRGGFVLLMLLLAPLLWRAAPPTGPRTGAPAAPRLGAAFALGAAAYAVQVPLLAAGRLEPWQWPLLVVMNGNPVVMCGLAWALFDDDFRLRRWHAGLWGAWVAMSVGNIARWHNPWLGALGEGGPILFSLLSLWPLLRSWRDDLVEARLRWRRGVLVGVMGYSVLAAWAGIPGARRHDWAGVVDAAALAVIGLVVARTLLAPRLGLWSTAAPATAIAAPVSTPTPGPADAPLSPAPAAAGEAAEPADPAALSRLQRAMAEDQLFRREGLTIGALAAQLGLPEYRLRRVINRQLGHRNFNTFLNGHRIAWACAALADPARAEVPVLTLALEAGFQSLGPFNRAFKAETGLTPTEYRARALAAKA